MDDIDRFLGKGDQTDINPFTGEFDPDRIFSQQADGAWRSWRMGSHETRNPKKWHYHLETWTWEGKVARPDEMVHVLPSWR